MISAQRDQAWATRASYATDLRMFALTMPPGRPDAVHRPPGPSGAVRPLDRTETAECTRRWTLASRYRHCEQDRLIDRNPVVNVRLPKVDYESRTLGLDRNDLGAFLVQAGLDSARDHTLIFLLAPNWLRISDALGADIDDLDYQRGQRCTGP